MHRQVQNAIALIVEGVAVNLSCEPNTDEVMDYIHQCIITNGLCLLKDGQGKKKGIFRGEKISGAYLTQIDITLQCLQIENLDLQNTQLKDTLNEDSWKH